MSSLVLLLSPLFAAILAGFIAGRLHLFGQAEARTFSRFVFSVAMPVAVFNFMRKSTPPDLTYAGMFLGYFIALAIVCILIFFLTRRFDGINIRQAGAAIFASTCGNAVFFGLPIAIGIPGWGVPFLMLMVCEGLFVFAIGTALMTWPEGHDAAAAGAIRKSISDAFVRVFRNPIIVGHLSGTVLSFARIGLPDVLGVSLDFLSGAASPVGLFVLGLYLAILTKEQEKPPVRVLAITLPIKLVLFPLLASGITWFFSRDLTLTTVAALFTGMPPAVASIVLASTYQQYERQVAAIVATGTVFGLITVTAFLVATVS